MRVYQKKIWYPDPDQRFLMRIRPNDTDPDPKHCLNYCYLCTFYSYISVQMDICAFYIFLISALFHL